MQIRTDDGLALEVTEAGRGSALVLVHGLGGAKEDFGDQFDELSGSHRVVAIDLRGHGASDGPEEERFYSLDRFAADLGNVADALELTTFRLLGHSMGGMIARRYALAAAHRVDALVLMDTSPGPVPGMDAEIIDLGVQIANEHGMDELKRVMDAFAPLGTPAYERVVGHRPGFREFGDRKWEDLSRAMYTAMLVEIRDQPDQLAELAAVMCPTLVMVGEQDAPFVGVSAEMAAIIDGAQHVVIPDAGHSPQFENGAVWLATLDAFLAGVGAESSVA